MKRGFSFGEMLVTLIIIGIISAVTIPVITRSVTANYKPLFKSAFNNVEMVVSELINDISIYPSGEMSNNTFCSNFFSKVNTIGSIDCSSDSTIPDAPNGTTTNSMKWYNLEDDFQSSTCPSGTSGECIKISVDINGDKGDNSTSSSNQDILDIYIFKSGKITVDGDPEETYLLN